MRFAAFPDLRHNLGYRGNHAAHPAVEVHGALSVHRKADVVHHLARAHLHRQIVHGRGNGFADRLRGEGPNRDRPEHAHPVAKLPAFAHGAAAYAAGGAVGYEHNLRVVQHFLLPAALAFGNYFIFGFQTLAMAFQHLGVDIQAVDDAARPARRGLVPVRSPGFLGKIGSRAVAVVQIHGFHHLADHAVAKHHDGVAVAVRNVESGLGQVHGFLHAGRRKHAGAVIAVPTAPRCLVIIALGGLNAAKPGAAAHDVDDHTRHLRAHQIADALLF